MFNTTNPNGEPMKKLVEMQLATGESVLMEVEDTSSIMRSGRSTEDSTVRRFDQALASLKPVTNTLLASLKDINTPAEIKLEFGITFKGGANVVFTSIESEANFKVAITWKNP